VSAFSTVPAANLSDKAKHRELALSEAIKLIVDGYVNLRDREALEELHRHRQTLRRRLQASSSHWFDTSDSVRLIDDELNEIEVGLARLR